ncbi:hypothetical protein M409DRAFT_66699 [Zasmidium cellare ATCC 36951]|uniref:NOL1/NOP2/Sun domain family member 4 n=1 Tax=Zasmidium cellare ATCC 36951 TaxID=1080233 RepID=A0A6A6CJ47_ZASCE|nr:uncharacterized protein M409DRAFT_66699 [Zasmidium cellare ATCC 36951]KAF2166208.1 hypothetical protein M409DRAFT_66699 [Zasmidium cellare ATCC 36951]
MTKTHRNGAKSADDAFNRHYAAIWGEERWNESLYPALLQPTRYACLLNRYSPMDNAEKLLEHPEVESKPLELPRRTLNSSDDGLRPNCFVRYTKDGEPADAPFPPPDTSTRILSHWNLDGASVLVASLLNVQPQDNVLDLCAAPGGKSIVLAQRLWPHLHADSSNLKQRVLTEKIRAGNLHSNEADGARQRRLAENLKAYLSKALFDSDQVKTLRVDGSKPNAEYELRVKTPTGTTGYDKVLVDAPCSSERHIIHAHARAAAGGRVADEMASWRPGSSKRLAKTQIDLLMTGVKAANVGATIVYATCSIEPTENDGVVEKVLAQVQKDKKKGIKWCVKVGFNGGEGDAELEGKLEKKWAEKTKYGWIVLPDHPSGGRWGPLFFAVLTKTAI